jgi:DNA topoisomerase I
MSKHIFETLYLNVKSDYINLLQILDRVPSYISDRDHDRESPSIKNQIFEEEITNNDNKTDQPIVVLKGGKSIKKWTTLEHHGVMFYPEYEPHGVPIIYGTGENKRPIVLNPEAEEFITYFVQSRFDKYRNDKFRKNFYNDWKKILSPEIRTTITDFALCNMDDIKKHVEETSEQKKLERQDISKEDREEEKAKNDKEKENYQYAIVDGQKQVIDNFLVEPPTIFVGRGDHPLSGSIKKRLYPEDITLNVGPNMPIPSPYIMNKGKDTDGSATNKERWGDVIQDNTLEWIASWQNNVTQKYNYARFGRKSGFKMKSDEDKYNKARMLKKKINKIREKNEKNMNSDNMETRQLATALYLIDKLALRIGNEKKEDEADTVGITTLKIKNVFLLDDSTIKLDFLGKDSIRYVNKFKVPVTVYNNIKEFHNDKDKANGDDLFDLINSDSLNKYIKSFMKKLTSKVFRTFNASYLMQIELKKISNKYKDYDKPDKLAKMHHEYEMANLKVAKLCNHQKLATKTSGVNIEKTQTKIKDMQTTLRKLKREKEKKIEENKKTTTINKRITSLQQKIKLAANKKSLQTESKTLSAGTSKINYIDPRITIAFLKANKLMDGLDKFFNKTHQKQFVWAMNVDETFKF